MRVAAVVPYHVEFCAGQRFRIETWARLLARRGISIEILPFADRNLTQVLYRPREWTTKARRMIACYASQARRLLEAKRPDLVYIYREASLIGPALLEHLPRRWRVPIIYDLDEPLFVRYDSPSNGALAALKFGPSKTNALLSMSDTVFVANRALADYAERHARRVSIVPFAVDTERYRPAPSPPTGQLLIGWTGTRTSQKNLDQVAGALARLTQTHRATLRVIADEPVAYDGVPVDFVPWSWPVEVPKMHDCHIAIVPVKPDVWSPWKFYYKLVQFMSLGLPVVASRVGSNVELLRDGETGFFADSEDEWHEKLAILAENPELRRRMGDAARAIVERQLSMTNQLDFVERTFKAAA
jgi:glycosyltransferase involved in cell wall biosynthesis